MFFKNALCHQICCSNVLFDKPKNPSGIQVGCCGSNIMFTSHQMCCAGKVVGKPQGVQNPRCCGNRVYNSQTQVLITCHSCEHLLTAVKGAGKGVWVLSISERNRGAAPKRIPFSGSTYIMGNPDFGKVEEKCHQIPTIV